MFDTKSKRDKNFDPLVTVLWKDDYVLMIDQTKLPNKLSYVKCLDHNEVANAIKKMVIRGAPAIGVAAGFGLALTAVHSSVKTVNELIVELDGSFKVLQSTRPTAINLVWALKRIMKTAKESKSIDEVKKAVLDEALKMADEDIETNKRLGF